MLSILLWGCGGSSERATVYDPVQDALETFNEALREAFDSVHALTAPPVVEADEEPDPVAPVNTALGSVLAAAQDLVKASAAQPIEPEAKAILSSVQQLVVKASSSSSMREVEDGIGQLRAKVAELRKQR